MPEWLRQERTTVALVLAGIAILYLSGLSTVGILDPEEGRHVSIATAMLRTGDFIVPQLQGFPYLEKPPLAYWLIACAFRLFGRNEFAARLPVAVLGIAAIASVFALAREVLGTRAAWMSAAVLALSTQWFAQARYMTTDMVLSAWITVALASFFWGVHSRRRGAFAIFFLSMGMATMAKGILGVAIPCGVVALFVAWTRRWKLLLDARPFLGAALFLALVLPWFFAVQGRIPEFLRYFVVDQHVARFLGSAEEHPAPWWFFIPVIGFGFFPWIVHLPAAAARSRRPKDLSVFLWSWFAVTFVFFSVAQEKLAGYILPAYPPIALLVGGHLARLWDPELAADTARRVCRAALVSGAVFLTLAPTAVFALRRFMEQDGRLSIGELGVWPWALASIDAAAGAALLGFGLRRRAAAALVASALAQTLTFLALVGGAAAAETWMGTRSIGSSLSRLASPGDAIVLYRVPQPSVEYYVGRPPTLYGWTGEHAWGMKVRPDRSLATGDLAELQDLLASRRTVWVITRAGDQAVFRELGVPMEPVLSNRKRTLYRYRAAEAP